MARFEIPTRVKIRGRWWKVKRNQDVDNTDFTIVGHNVDSKKNSAWDGLTIRHLKEIHLAKQIYGTAYERVVLLHEIMHACSREKITAAQEEKFCTDIDEAFLKALEALPWL